MPLRRVLTACAFCLLACAEAPLAQVYNLPTPPPAVSAADRDWYRQRLPILFAGDWYYPAGARYHFNPDVMVPVGTYDGLPLYADSTVEPYSELLVPVGGGLVQPYERRRTGQLAGTTGSRAPSLPVDVVPWGGLDPGQAWPARPAPSEQPEEEMAPRSAEGNWPRPDEERAREQLLELPGRIETIREPEDNRGIWIVYEGQRWNIAGKAVPFDPGRFRQLGAYHGFPVFAAAGTDEIFIPAAAGMLAVYAKDKT